MLTELLKVSHYVALSLITSYMQTTINLINVNLIKVNVQQRAKVLQTEQKFLDNSFRSFWVEFPEFEP